MDIRMMLWCGASAFALLGAFAAPRESFPHGGPLVSTAWLAENLRDPRVRIIEVTLEDGPYQRGHIPGAIEWRWRRDLCAAGSRDIIPAGRFEEICSSAGISRETPVILYSAQRNWWAAWAAWVFAGYGHPDVRILDGGRAKWEMEKRPLEREIQRPEPTRYKVAEAVPSFRARLADVLQILERRDSSVLLDVRSPQEYGGNLPAPAGLEGIGVRRGRIPGARHVEWSEVLNGDDTFKSMEDLRELYTRAGLGNLEEPVIVYCQTGLRACHSWFVLHRLIGFRNARVYDGSWSEYGNAVGVPIEK